MTILVCQLVVFKLKKKAPSHTTHILTHSLSSTLADCAVCRVRDQEVSHWSYVTSLILLITFLLLIALCSLLCALCSSLSALCSLRVSLKSFRLLSPLCSVYIYTFRVEPAVESFLFY